MDLMNILVTSQYLHSNSGGASTQIQEKTVDIAENGTVEVVPDEGYTLSKVVANVEVSNGGDEGSLVDAIIDGSVTEIVSNAESIRLYAFRGCTSLTSINARLATSAGNGAFYECTGLIHANLPKITSIGSNMFEGCTQLTSVDMPLLSSITGGYSFYNCQSLTSVNMPLLSSIIADRTFRSCKNLTSIDLPELTKVGTGTFTDCTSLTSVNLPKLSVSTGSEVQNFNGMKDMFNGCTALPSITLPSITVIYEAMFQKCSSLKKVDTPAVVNILNFAFDKCTSLVALILRSDTCSGLQSTSVFSSTPITSGTGYIYVPAALVDSYKSATNWSNYASQFRALEDYTVDCTTTGELDETKI